MGSGGAAGPLVPRSAEPFTEREGRRRLPDRLGAHQGGNRRTPSDPEGADAPAAAGTSSHCACSASRTSTGSTRPVMFFSNHSSHLDATLILTTLPDVWQAKTAVGRGTRLLLRRVVATGVHGARVRRVPDRPVARRARRRGQGPGADRGRVEPGRVPGGHPVAGRSRAAVPPRHVAVVPRARHRGGAHRDPRRASGHAQGTVLAEGRSSHRHRSLRHAAVPGGRRDASGLLAPDGPGGRPALRRGPDRRGGIRFDARSERRDADRSRARRAPTG